jgi:hypothetical protein
MKNQYYSFIKDKKKLNFDIVDKIDIDEVSNLIINEVMKTKKILLLKVF